MQTKIIEPGHPLWHNAAELIRGNYRKYFDAQISEMAPRLGISIGCDGSVIGACGIRFAKDHFFSDSYIKDGCAAAITRETGFKAQNEDLIEIVNFATSKSCVVLPLLRAVTDYGRIHGKRWGLFTATSTIRRILQRTGSEMIFLAPATSASVENKALWGRYYEADPWVCALDDQAGKALEFIPEGKMPCTITERLSA